MVETPQGGINDPEVVSVKVVVCEKAYIHKMEKSEVRNFFMRSGPIS
jgi:hypothetical protein